MSLEAALQENTATMKLLIDAFKSQGKLQVIPVTDAKPAKTDKPKPDVAAPQPAAAPPKPAPTYDDAKTVLLEVAAKSKEAALKILADVQPGAKKLPDLKPESYGAVIEACKAQLAAK